MADVPISEPLHDRLEQLVAVLDERGHPTTVAAQVSDAVTAHLERLVGDPDHPLPPTEFTKLGSDQPAQAVLRQDSDLGFVVVEPFTYASAGGGPTWTVPAGMHTDLASVPTWLTWLVPRYGRHTLSALVHDLHQDPAHAVTSWRADEVFRDSMRAAGVPFVRRWAMWSAVATRTLFGKDDWSWPGRILVIVWLAAYGVGVGLLGWAWLLREAIDHGPALAAGEVAVILVAAVLAVLQDRTRTDAAGCVVPARLARGARTLFPVAAGLVIGWSVLAAGVLAARGDTWAPAIQLALVASPVVTSVVWWVWQRRTHRVGLISGVAVSLLAVPGLLVVWAVLVYRAAEAFAGLAGKGDVPVSRGEWRVRFTEAGILGPTRSGGDGGVASPDPG